MSSDLESKLLSLCGRLPPDRPVVPPSQEAPPRGTFKAAVAGANLPISDPSLDIGGTTQSETTTAVAGQVVCAAWNDAGEGFGLNGFSGFGFSLDGGNHRGRAGSADPFRPQLPCQQLDAAPQGISCFRVVAGRIEALEHRVPQRREVLALQREVELDLVELADPAQLVVGVP
jgi:hypothetical protein